MNVKSYIARYISTSTYATKEGGGIYKAPEVEQLLERMLADGWELVTMTQVHVDEPSKPNYLAVFRRVD